jgi:CheY-like chemotaxis protein
LSREHQWSDFGDADDGDEPLGKQEPMQVTIARLIDPALSSIVANIEYAVGVLSGVTQLAMMEGGKASVAALESIAQALAEAGASSNELSALLTRLKTSPEVFESDGRKLDSRFARRDSGLLRLSRVREGALPRVLVIDDDDAVSRTIQRILCDRYEIVLEPSSSAAVYQLLLGEEYDVILCDVVMPTMSGIDVFNVVSATRRELAARFVFMSGGIESPDALEFFEHAPNVLVSKPFTVERLTNAIDSVLHLHR